jgi:hypothetical protein
MLLGGALIGIEASASGLLGFHAPVLFVAGAALGAVVVGKVAVNSRPGDRIRALLGFHIGWAVMLLVGLAFGSTLGADLMGGAIRIGLEGAFVGYVIARRPVRRAALIGAGIGSMFGLCGGLVADSVTFGSAEVPRSLVTLGILILLCGLRGLYFGALIGWSPRHANKDEKKVAKAPPADPIETYMSSWEIKRAADQ